MVDLNRLGTEQSKILLELEADVRERLIPARDPNAPELPVSAMLHARASMGMGINLENTCPYFRACGQQRDESCVGPNNYRGKQCYGINLALNEDVGILNAILSQAVGAT